MVCVGPGRKPRRPVFSQRGSNKVLIIFSYRRILYHPIQLCVNYTPGIYADGYIVFVFPFIRLYVCLFVRSYFRHVCRICVKVLRQSFSSGVYLSNYLSESIHIWTIVTLEGWHSLHDPRPQGPCPGVGLEVKI